MHYVALWSYWLDLQVQAFYLLRGCCGSISAGCDAWLSSPSPPPSQSSSSSWTRTYTQDCIHIHTYTYCMYNVYIYISTYIYIWSFASMQSIYAHSAFLLLTACYSPIRLAAWPSSLRRHSFVQLFPGPLAIEPHGILVRSGMGPRTKEQVTRSQKCSKHWNRDDVSLQSEMCTYCSHIARCAHIM